MPKIKIGLDGFPLNHLNGGISYYIFHLLDELIAQIPEADFFIYSAQGDGAIKCFLKYPNVHLRIYPQCKFSHCLWRQTTLAYAIFKDDLDIFWGSTQSIPLVKKKKVKTILTLYDFAYRVVPKTFPLFFRLYFRWLMPLMLKRAHSILPISHFTGKELKRMHQIEYDEVVYPPLKPQMSCNTQSTIEQLIARDNLKYKEFVLTVGTIEPRKNLLGLLQVYEKTLKQYELSEIWPLVVIGSGGWKNTAIHAMLQHMQKEFPTHVIVLGYFSDKELPFILGGARYYIALSIYEGYGMPLAEARSCGTKVVSFNLPVFHEATEGDAIFLDPLNFEKTLMQIFLRKNRDLSKENRPIQYASNFNKAAIIAKKIRELLFLNQKMQCIVK